MVALPCGIHCTQQRTIKDLLAEEALTGCQLQWVPVMLSSKNNNDEFSPALRSTILSSHMLLFSFLIITTLQRKKQQINKSQTQVRLTTPAHKIETEETAETQVLPMSNFKISYFTAPSHRSKTESLSSCK